MTPQRGRIFSGNVASLPQLGGCLVGKHTPPTSHEYTPYPIGIEGYGDHIGGLTEWHTMGVLTPMSVETSIGQVQRAGETWSSVLCTVTFLIHAPQNPKLREIELCVYQTVQNEMLTANICIRLSETGTKHHWRLGFCSFARMRHIGQSGVVSGISSYPRCRFSLCCGPGLVCIRCVKG